MKKLLIYICLNLALVRAKQSHINDEAGIDKTATIIFVGDITFDGPIKYFAEKEKSCDYRLPFEKVKKFLADADLRVANLESPFVAANAGSDIEFNRKLIHHFGNLKAVEGLKYAGFDIVQLANNHISDLGYRGIKSTIRTLKNAKIDYVGLMNAGMHNKRQNPVIKNINGIKIGFLAYCQQKEECDRLHVHGPAVFDRIIAKKEIKELKRAVHIVVILLHWSKELLPVPPKGVRDLANVIRLLGANLIIGQHPHVVQGHECIKETAVVYSLGNFLFPKAGVNSRRFLYDGNPSSEDVTEYSNSLNTVFNPTQLSYMFRVTVSRKGIEEAHYLQLEIKNDPTTNCLQPTPKTGRWERFCSDEEDYFCFDFRSIYAVTAEMLDDTDYKVEKDTVKNRCIRRKY